MNRNKFPRKESERNAYFKIVLLFLEQNADRFGIERDRIDNLKVLLDNWTNWYEQSLNEELTNKLIVSNKDAASENLEAALNVVYGDLPQSKLTKDDRNTLHLQLPSNKRTPAGVPTTRPVGQVLNGSLLEHKITFTDEDGKRGKPEKVRGCQIFCKEGITPPEDEREMRLLASDASSPYVHKFSFSDAGKTFYYRLRWENSRGEAGPWSAFISGVVTG